MEALLLLSQQEERYYLESKTIQGLEFQIKDLNEKISQVAHLLVADILGFNTALIFSRLFHPRICSDLDEDHPAFVKQQS